MMKKIIVLLLTIFGIFFIYYYYNHKMINYVSIGDGLIRRETYANNISYGYNNYVQEYLNKQNKVRSFNNLFYNKTINGLTKDIQKNRTIRINNNEYYLKKVLRESDVLVISIGMEELFSFYRQDKMNDNFNYFNKMYHDIEKLISEIKKYTKGMIIFLGYYNPTSFYNSKTDEFFYHMDIKLNRLMMDNNIIYVDLYEEVKGNQYHKHINTPFLTSEGYKKIASIIEYYLS